MAKYRLSAVRVSHVEWIIDSEKINKSDLDALLNPSHPEHDDIMQLVLGGRPDDEEVESDDLVSLDSLGEAGKYKKTIWG